MSRSATAGQLKASIGVTDSCSFNHYLHQIPFATLLGTFQDAVMTVRHRYLFIDFVLYHPWRYQCLVVGVCPHGTKYSIIDCDSPWTIRQRTWELNFFTNDQALPTHLVSLRISDL